LAILSRTIVSYAYGFTVVLFPLYLKKIGFSVPLVGITVFAAMVINAALAVFAGMIADHYGRKYVLTALLLVFALSASVTTLVTSPVLLALLAGFAGFTSGATGGPIGSGGPLGAVQTAIISEVSSRKEISQLLGIAAVLEMSFAMLGAFSITTASYLGLSPYFLFYVAAALGFASAIGSTFIRDMGIRSQKLVPSLSYKNVFMLSLPTIPCGLGSGLVIPLLSLWFKLRYNATAAEIGAVFGAMDLAMVAFTMVIPRLAPAVGRLKIIILTRVASSLSFILMAFSPAFPIAGAFLVLRGAFAMGGMPVRQAFVMLNVHETERATANGSTSLSRNAASSVGAAISGYAMREFATYLPLVGVS
jgi:MFS family permease